MARHDSYRISQIDVAVVRRDGDLSLYVNPIFVDGSIDYKHELGRFDAEGDYTADSTRFYTAFKISPAPLGVPPKLWEEALKEGFTALEKLVGL